MPTTQEIKQWIEDAIKWHRHDGVLTQLVYLTQLFGYRRRWGEILDINELSFSLVGDTNGTTTVHMFSQGVVPAPFFIMSIFLIAKDTTAGNITVAVNGNTITTIAKSTTSGGMTGAVSLSNQSIVPGDDLTIVSSSSGNARVHFMFLFPNN